MPRAGLVSAPWLDVSPGELPVSKSGRYSEERRRKNQASMSPAQSAARSAVLRLELSRRFRISANIHVVTGYRRRLALCQLCRPANAAQMQARPASGSEAPAAKWPWRTAKGC